MNEIQIIAKPTITKQRSNSISTSQYLLSSGPPSSVADDKPRYLALYEKSKEKE
jgi:hypothetical protein